MNQNLVGLAVKPERLSFNGDLLLQVAEELCGQLVDHVLHRETKLAIS